MLTPQTIIPAPTPNALFAKNITITGNIWPGGKLGFTAEMSLVQAFVSNPGTPNETWQQVGVGTKPFVIPNCENLAANPRTVAIAACQPQLDAAFAALETAIAALNAALKLA